MTVSYEERRRTLIELLHDSASPISLEHLQQSLSCSRRTVYYLISKVNEELNEQSLGFIRNRRGQGWYLTDSQRQHVPRLLASNQTNVHLRPDERRDYLACWLQYPPTAVHVDTIMQSLDISRNTVFNDLKALRSELEGYDLWLDYDSIAGYAIKGAALSKRTVLLFHLKRLLADAPYMRLEFLDPSIVKDYLDRLNAISSMTDSGYADADLLLIACTLAIICNANDTFDCSLLEIQSLEDTREHQLVKERFNDLSEYEQLYLSVQLLGSRAGRLARIDEGDDDIRLFELAQRFVNLFEHVTHCDFIEKDGLVNSLYMHFKLSAYYHRLSIQVINPFLQEVKDHYLDLYRLVSELGADLREAFPFPLFDSEITYITMHFAGHLRQSASPFYRGVRVLVVCPSGMATSKLLSREIEQLYANVTVVAIIQAEEVNSYLGEADFIVTTVPIRSEIPWIKVSPLMTDADRSRIASMMALHMNPHVLADGREEGLFEILSAFVPDDRMPDLKRAVYAFLQKGGSFIEIPDRHQPGVLDLLTPDFVTFVDTAPSWRDAIRLSAAPLLNANLVTDAYVQAMIDLVDENGPYIVLHDNVALAHAEPQQGARALCLSLLISVDPIQFGEGRCARLLFTLANPEQGTHLHALREIMNLSKRSALVSGITRCRNAESALSLLNKHAADLTDAEEIAIA
ncbi:BglG family transcription antiterminator [Collinsella vaginalis]|uniref:BglG family transcription antiterminator n=1 Tax=Collinsella vaginalis TaxID=1870987 RepID=UPI000A26A464|nr:BglG family transcription antiterminator [Collinsella vaginalis]